LESFDRLELLSLEESREEGGGDEGGATGRYEEENCLQDRKLDVCIFASDDGSAAKSTTRSTEQQKLRFMKEQQRRPSEQCAEGRPPALQDQQRKQRKPEEEDETLKDRYSPIWLIPNLVEVFSTLFAVIFIRTHGLIHDSHTAAMLPDLACITLDEHTTNVIR